MMNCFRNMPSNNFEKCPLPNCPCDPSMNFDQKTEHVLQYATKNLFLNDLEEDPSERTIPNIWMTKWKKDESRIREEYRKLTKHQMLYAITVLSESVPELIPFMKNGRWEKIMTKSDRIFNICEICGKNFAAPKRMISNVLANHRKLKHYEKLLDHSPYLSIAGNY